MLPAGLGSGLAAVAHAGLRYSSVRMRQALLALVRRAAGVPRVEARIERVERQLDLLASALGELPARVRDDVQVIVSDSTNYATRRMRIERAEELEALQGRLEVVRGQLVALNVETRTLVESRISDHGEAIRLHAQRHAEELGERTFEVLDRRMSAQQQRLDALRSVLERGATTPLIVSPNAQLVGQAELAPISDDLYSILEERFRGDMDTISARQKEYLGYISSAVSCDHPALDLGPGRGEWLRLLREEGHPALGIESNVVFVDRARQEGLDIREGDLVRFLEEAEEGSFGAITLFQVIEHLPFSVTLKVMRDAQRSLAPGGVLLVETPNSENVRVGSSTFWIDPTHIRPIHPAVLLFLAEEVGLVRGEVLFRNRLGPEFDLAALEDSALARAVHQLTETLNGPGDVTLVAWKADA